MKKKPLDMPAVWLALIALAGIAAYSNTIHSPFLFDDRPVVAGNALIRHIENIPSLLAGGAVLFSSRAVMHATFALNYYFGGQATTGYHAANIALHLINGLLLYLLVLATARHTGQEEGRARALALLSSAIFVLHPALTEAVTNVVNRSMLLSTAFYLSGTLLFLRAVTRGRRRWMYVAGLFFASLAGMGSRENFAMFPLMLVLYDLFFVSRFRPKELVKHYRAYVPVLLSAGYIVYLVFYNTYARRSAIPGIPPVDYVLTELGVQWTYIRLLLLPVNQTVDYDFPVATRLIALPTLLAASGYTALWAGAIAAARRRPAASYGVLWFLITLLPISFIVALTNLKLDDVIFEHRLYLPAAGVVVLAAWVVIAATDKMRQRWGGAGRAVAPVLIVVLLASLALAAYHRNEVWRSDKSLWEDAAMKAPGKARPHNDLGIVYMNEGRAEEAIEQSLLTIRLDPAYAPAYINLGNSYSALGQLDRAIDYYKMALVYRPFSPEAFYNTGLAYQKKGAPDRAQMYYERAIELNPYYADAHLNLGIIYGNKGLTGLARKEFERVLEINPGDERAMNNLRLLDRPPHPGVGQE